jgi:ADP-ribose pyrophosphatase YjhB (NUDIX family)
MDAIKLIGLGIIHEEGKVLIGKRKDKDEFVESLTWGFPGGEVGGNIEESLKRIIKEETKLDVEIKELVYVRKPPEPKISIVLFYFDCIPTNRDEKAGGDLVELMWIKPTSVREFFTTSLSDKVMELLRSIEEKKL